MECTVLPTNRCCFFCKESRPFFWGGLLAMVRCFMCCIDTALPWKSIIIAGSASATTSHKTEQNKLWNEIIICFSSFSALAFDEYKSNHVCIHVHHIKWLLVLSSFFSSFFLSLSLCFRLSPEPVIDFTKCISPMFLLSCLQISFIREIDLKRILKQHPKFDEHFCPEEKKKQRTMSGSKTFVKNKQHI